MRPLILLLLLTVPASAAEPFLLKPNDVVLFLGDSITFAGGYVAQIDAVLRSRRPTEKFTLINLGLPSETCTGLTETDHPFPRPDVHERLDRALAEIKPTVVFIGYGMNDGIYHPFDQKRFDAYKAGIAKLLEKVRAAKARPLLLTPSPFDALPIQAKTRPADAADFSYKAPFADYDGVLRRYSDWLLTLRKADLPVIDVHAAVTRYLHQRRRTEPNFTLARDGIHPDTVGHTLIARAILAGLNYTDDDLVTIPPQGAKVEIPLPLVPSVNGPTLVPVRLTVNPAPRPGTRYELLADGQVVGTVRAADLAAGLDLGTLPKLPAVTRGRQFLDAVRKQHAVLDLALLTAIGHKRPQTPKGISLDEARQQAMQIEKTLPGLVGKVSVPFTLRLIEAKPEPKPVAHRGLFKHAPENTLPGYAACAALRLGAEVDVRRTRDGQLVVLHDATLQRTTNGSGPVAEATAAAVARLDAGAWFDAAYQGAGVPSLEAVLKLFAERGEPEMPIALDIKVSDERLAADVVALARKHKVLGRILFIGNTIESAALRQAFKAAAPEAAPARLVPRPDDLTEALADDTADWIYLRWLPTAEQVRAIHGKGKRVFVAGALVAGIESANWKRLAEVGVDAILTDYPLELRQQFRGK